MPRTLATDGAIQSFAFDVGCNKFQAPASLSPTFVVISNDLVRKLIRMNSSSLSASANSLLPPVWSASALAQLSPQENVLACLEVDLNAQLQFAQGLLIVTDQRVLSAQRGVSSQVEWSSFPLSADLTMQHTDYAGVGTLTLVQVPTPA